MPCFSMNRDVITSDITVLTDSGAPEIGFQSFIVTVPEGKVVLSGGYDMGSYANPETLPPVVRSKPTADGTGWEFAFLGGSHSRDITLYVVYEDA